MRQCSQTWRKATAVGDTTKAYFFKQKIQGVGGEGAATGGLQCQRHEDS